MDARIFRHPISRTPTGDPVLDGRGFARKAYRVVTNLKSAVAALESTLSRGG